MSLPFHKLVASLGGFGPNILVAFLGDPQIGSGPEREQGDILNFRRQTQVLKASGVNYALSLGDNVMNGTAAQATWQHDGMRFCVNEMAPIPNSPMIGNHDIWNNTTGLEETGGSAAITTWLSAGNRGEQLNMPAGGLANLGNYVFDLSENGIEVRFVVWNSDPTRSAAAYPSKYTSGEHDSCMVWLTAALSAAGSWKSAVAGRRLVFCLHQPLYCSLISDPDSETSIPASVTGHTYTTPRSTILGWVRSAKCDYLMSGHTGENRTTVVAESSGGAGDGFVMTETVGTSIAAPGHYQSYRTLRFTASGITNTLIPLADTPVFAGSSWTTFDTLVAATARHYFRFDEQYGVAAIDEIGTNAGAMRWEYSGTIGYGSTALGAMTGTALDLSNGYIYSNGPYTQSAGSQSYKFLCLWESNGTVRGIMQSGVLGGAGANKGITIRVTTDGRIEFNVADGSGNRITVNSAVLSLSLPHVVTCVYDSVAQKASVYVDGALSAEAACVGFTVTTNSLCQVGTAGAQRYVGKLDQFSLHEVALSASAIAAQDAVAL